MARACPYEKSSRGEEAQGKPGVTRRVTTEAQSVNDKNGETSKKSRILELRQELCRAELEEALEEVSGVLGVLQSDTTSSTAGLGSTVFASILVDGVATRALIDTGSPATIISLKFILNVLAGQKTPNQTVQQWKEDVRKKFLTPDISLQNYGGHRLYILARICVNLS